MYRFLDHPDLFNKLILLEGGQAEPIVVINRFCSDFTLSEVRSILWDWFEVAITSDNDQYSSPTDRADLLLRYRRLEELIEANFIMHKKHLNYSYEQ